MLPQTIDYLITPHCSHGEPLSRGDQEPPPKQCKLLLFPLMASRKEGETLLLKTPLTSKTQDLEESGWILPGSLLPKD